MGNTVELIFKLSKGEVHFSIYGFALLFVDRYLVKISDCLDLCFVFIISCSVGFEILDFVLK